MWIAIFSIMYFSSTSSIQTQEFADKESCLTAVRTFTKVNNAQYDSRFKNHMDYDFNKPVVTAFCAPRQK